MPFKDINYKALDEADRVYNQLRKKVAVIDKLSSRKLTPKAKLATVELLTGKVVQPPVDPVKTVLQQQETDKTLVPILAEIEDLKDTIQEQTDTIAVHHPQAQAAIQAPAAGIDLYERFGITDEDQQLYEFRGFDNLNALAQANDQPRVKETLKRLTSLSKSLGGQKSGINKRLFQSPRAQGQLDDVNNELRAINKYKAVVKRIKTGTGLLQIGSYQAPLKHLKRDNILSVRYAKSNKMVPAFNATRVSDNVKGVLLNKQLKKPISLSEGEKSFLDRLYLNAGHSVTPSKAKTIRGGSIMTSLEEIIGRIQVLFGELTAGNTSNVMKNELSELLHYLYKHKKLRKDIYTQLISTIVKHE